MNMWLSKRRKIIEMATSDVISAPPTLTVKALCDKIMKSGKRRLPIVNEKKNVKGIVTSTDIVNYLGGGPKYEIIKKEFKDNFLSAINAPVSKIMTPNVFCINENEPVDAVADKFLHHYFGGMPILDEDNVMVGFVTEHDFISPLAGEKFRFPARNAMTKKVITITPNTTLKDASRIMIANRLRRLPVITEGSIVGMLRAHEILKFISHGDFAKFKTSKAEVILSDPANDVMSKDFYVVDEELDIGEVIKLARNKRTGGFPVVRGDKLVGLITERDIFRSIYSTLKAQFPKKFNEIVYTLFAEK
jgi:CBS domain-containing protein